MSIKTRRLKNDFRGVSKLISESGGTLKIISKKGQPPYYYLIEYNCRGIERLRGNKPIFRNTHQVEISVAHSDYPFRDPDAKFLTPIFHPNVWEDLNVCLGSYWTPSETIAELILRIGKIIQYSPDVLNLKSPANRKATSWAEKNRKLLPLYKKKIKKPI